MEQVVLFTPPSIKILNTESPFLDPLEVEIKLTLQCSITAPIVWRAHYIDGSGTEQLLVQVPMNQSTSNKVRFILKIPPPAPELVSVTSLLTSAVYNISAAYKDSQVWSTALYLSCRDTSGKFKPIEDKDISGDSLTGEEVDESTSEDDVASGLLTEGEEGEEEGEDEGGTEGEVSDAGEDEGESSGSSESDAKHTKEPEVKHLPEQMGSKAIFATFVKCVKIFAARPMDGVYTVKDGEEFS